MRRLLLGGVAATGLLFGGFAITGATVSAQTPDDNGDVYECPAGSTSDYKIDNLNSETFTVPQPTAGNVIVAVIVKAATEHRTYDDVEPDDVINVKADMGHNISHAHICEGPPPPPPNDEEPTTTASTLPPPTPQTPAPQAAPSVTVAAAGPVPPAVAPAVAPAAAPAAAPPAPAQSALPSTGSSSWGLALTALASLLGGLGLVKLSRRTS